MGYATYEFMDFMISVISWALEHYFRKTLHKRSFQPLFLFRFIPFPITLRGFGFYHSQNVEPSRTELHNIYELIVDSGMADNLTAVVSMDNNSLSKALELPSININ